MPINDLALSDEMSLVSSTSTDPPAGIRKFVLNVVPACPSKITVSPALNFQDTSEGIEVLDRDDELISTSLQFVFNSFVLENTTPLLSVT